MQWVLVMRKHLETMKIGILPSQPLFGDLRVSRSQGPEDWPGFSPQNFVRAPCGSTVVLSYSGSLLVPGSLCSLLVLPLPAAHIWVSSSIFSREMICYFYSATCSCWDTFSQETSLLAKSSPCVACPWIMCYLCRQHLSPFLW